MFWKYCTMQYCTWFPEVVPRPEVGPPPPLVTLSRHVFPMCLLNNKQLFRSPKLNKISFTIISGRVNACIKKQDS
jgi:hypothetical protein